MLAVVVLLPTAGMAVLATSSASSLWSQKRAAADVSRDAVSMQHLIALRGEVNTEYVQAAALTTAADLGVDAARLNTLYGVDFTANLKAARREVDADKTLPAIPELAANMARLNALRLRVDAGNAGFAAVDAFFTRFMGEIDSLWQRRLDSARRLADDDPANGASQVRAQIDVVQATFTALTDASDRTKYTNNLLLGRRVPPNVKALIEANARFTNDVALFHGRLGPKAAAAWRALQRDPSGRRFDRVIDQAVNIGLVGAPSPFASDPTAYGAALTDAGRWIIGLAIVNGAASTDLDDYARHLETTAKHSFVTEILAAAFVALLASVVAALTARAVGHPARRLATSARRISEGEFTIAALPPRGPRELAETARALNDVTATLTALERYAMTLAEAPDSALLNQPLPGRTGQALQVTLDRLRDSVHEREEHRVALQELATHDGLTGLLNRAAALDSISRELSRSQRDGTPMMVLFIDLDAFKGINDTYGHDVGDAALRLTADALRATTRNTDVVARLGGDEFLVSGRAADGEAEVEIFAQRLHDGIASRAVSVGGKDVALESSIGIAMAEPGDTADSLIRNADGALYVAKQRGRNQVVWHRPEAWEVTS